MKRVSVIIPNTNSPRIGDILHRLRHQTIDMSEAEVLVVGVDNPGLVKQDALVRFVPTPPTYASQKRNIGMQLAQGDIFLFLDDDCLPTAHWIASHLTRHGQGEQVVGGSVTFGTRHYLQLADNVSAFHDLLPFMNEGPSSYLAAANLSVRRAVAQQVGPMEEQLRRAEDLEWTVRCRRFGYQLYFEPRALVYHDPARHTLPAVWRHWWGDASDTLHVRLRYQQLLQTPELSKNRWVFLWGAPLIAAWATARIFQHPGIARRYWHTLPLVYLTKMAWCWGAYTGFPSERRTAPWHSA